MPGDAKVTAGQLYDPLREKSAILSLLVLAEDEQPFLYADLDLDNTITENERFPLEPEDYGNPYILQTTIQLPFKNSLLKTYPIVVQYFKDVGWDELKEGENLILQSKAAYARGFVDFDGKKTLVQYTFNPQSKKISINKGWLGVDSDGDKYIDLDHFSPRPPKLATRQWSVVLALDLFRLRKWIWRRI